jgi:hypothetical protein
MKLKVLITRHDALLYEGIYDVSDARSFGDACADIWTKLAQRNLAAASSIGAVYEALSDDTLPDLRLVQIRFEQIEP